MSILPTTEMPAEAKPAINGEKGIKGADATPAATPMIPSTPETTDFIEVKVTFIFDSFSTLYTSFIEVSSL